MLTNENFSILKFNEIDIFDVKNSFSIQTKMDLDHYYDTINKFKVNIEKEFITNYNNEIQKKILTIKKDPDEILNFQTWLREYSISDILEENYNLNNTDLETKFFNKIGNIINNYKYCLTNNETFLYLMENFSLNAKLNPTTIPFNTLSLSGFYYNTELWVNYDYKFEDYKLYLFNEPIKTDISEPSVKIDENGKEISFEIESGFKSYYPDFYCLKIIK